MTITGEGISVSVPVGIVGLTVDFGDVDLTLRVDIETGTVRLGDQIVTSSAAAVQAAAPLDADKDQQLDMAEPSFDFDAMIDSSDTLFAQLPALGQVQELQQLDQFTSWSFA